MTKIDEAYQATIKRETKGFTNFTRDNRPRVGSKRVFVFAAFSDKEYIARRFELVTVVRAMTDDEYEYMGDRMFLIKAEDGWEGSAWASELYPVKL